MALWRFVREGHLFKVIQRTNHGTEEFLHEVMVLSFIASIVQGKVDTVIRCEVNNFVPSIISFHCLSLVA